MKKIQFSNFKRFIDFPTLEFGPITFLVGRNNSGKSTLVKSLLLINNYFQSNRLNKFNFSSGIIDDINIGTFGRARNNGVNGLNSISFTYQVNNFEVSIEITANDDETIARVIKLNINDLANGYFFHIMPSNSFFDIVVGKTVVEQNHYLNSSTREIDLEIKNSENWLYINNNLKKSSKNYLMEVDNLNRLIEKRAKIQGNLNLPVIKYSAELSSDSYIDKSMFEIGSQIIDVLENDYKNNINVEGLDIEEADFYKTLKVAFDDKINLEKTFNNFLNSIKNHVYIYIGANSIKQRAIFSIKDSSNPLAQAIHEYYQLGIILRPGSPANIFILKWIKEFEIGDNFKLVCHAGEAYELLIYNSNKVSSISDMGMGSAQAMLLLLKLACIIDKHDEFDRTITVLIEEPESNLHPALQSIITDMFLYVNQLKSKKLIRCNIEFIVETHSEYMIRKSQVIVAESDFEDELSDNPFCVHYFPKEFNQTPYQLRFQPDGTFDKNFGPGFFDTASLEILKLLRIKREKKV
jgi:predicted ATPase